MTDDAPNRKQRRILRWEKVHQRVARSRTQVWRDIRASKFPAPVKLGPNSVGWYEDEIDAWIEARARVSYGEEAA